MTIVELRDCEVSLKKAKKSKGNKYGNEAVAIRCVEDMDGRLVGC